MWNITYYEQNIYENINNFAAFIKIISVHSVTYVIIKTLTDLTPTYYPHWLTDHVPCSDVKISFHFILFSTIWGGLNAFQLFKLGEWG